MITLTRPSDSQIHEILLRVANAHFTYDQAGCIGQQTPPGFVLDVAVFRLGIGHAVWMAARKAILEWIAFPRTMVSMVRLSDAIECGTVVAVICKAMGTWTTNPARILSVHDTFVNGLYRFGFTYGTLPGHVESGEELFSVEWNRNTNEVTYHINAISRPKHFLCWLAYPYTRMMQAKFRRLSGIAMQEFVAEKAS